MKRFKNILLVSDLDSKDNNALYRAIELAERNQAQLTVVDVIDELPSVFKKIFSTNTEEIESQLIKERMDNLKKNSALSAGRIEHVNIDVIKGRGFVEIIRRVQQKNHDLVIIPSENPPHLKGHIFGSTSMHLMRKCPCPVWVVKSEADHKYLNILAAVKLDEDEASTQAMNQKILELSSSIAESEGGNLHVIFIWDLWGGRFLKDTPHKDRERFAETMRQEYHNRMADITQFLQDKNYALKTHVIQGEAICVIPKQVKEDCIDLVVMGTVSRSGISGLLIGNTAEGVLQQVDCSVLTVKPDGFETPIQ